MGGGAATLGYDARTALAPLTVSFAEPQFLAGLNAEHRFTQANGFWFQLSVGAKSQAKVGWGPANPQALNRYAYVLNNPVRYTDPSGHCVFVFAFLCAAAAMIGGGGTAVAVGGGTGVATVGATGSITVSGVATAAGLGLGVGAAITHGEQAIEFIVGLGEQLKIKLINQETGEVLYDSDAPRETHAYTGTAAPLPPSQEPQWDPDWDWRTKLAFVLARLGRIIVNPGGPHPPAPPAT